LFEQEVWWRSAGTCSHPASSWTFSGGSDWCAEAFWRRPRCRPSSWRYRGPKSRRTL